MKELKRVLLNKIWFVILIALLVCNVVFYCINQPARLNTSLKNYNAYNSFWGEKIVSLSDEEGLALLNEEEEKNLVWFLAEVTLTSIQDGTVDEQELALFRQEYPDFDAVMESIREGQKPSVNMAESIAIERWINRLNYRTGYKAHIQSIADQAAVIQSNPLFSKPGSFSYRNAEQTLLDFRSIEDTPLLLHPFDVVESLMDNRGNLLFSICLVFAAVVLLLEPNRLGMDLVERSCSNGRTHLAAWRCLTLLIASILSAILMIGSLLIAGMVIYQQGIPLSAPVQSMAFFQNWTAHTSVGAFLLWMVLIRAAGLWVIGLLFWILLGHFRSIPVGLILSASFLGIEYNWFISYQLNDVNYPLAAFNLFQLISVEKIAGQYLNYNFFSYPINERIVIPAIILIFLVLLVSFVLLRSSYSKGSNRLVKVRNYLNLILCKLRKQRNPKSMFLYECRKALSYAGGGLLLVAGVLFLMQLDAPSANQLPAEMMLTNYIQEYEGPVSEEVYQEILMEKENAEQEYTEIASSASVLGDLSYYQTKCEATDLLVTRYQMLLDLKNSGLEHIELVNELPLDRIYGEAGNSYRFQSAAATLLLLCLFIPGLFWIDCKNGMRLSLLATANGRNRLWQKKAAIAFIAGFFIWALWTVKELWLLHSIRFRWSALKASGESLSYWLSLDGTPLSIPLLFHYIMRLLGVFATVGTMLGISALFPALLSAGGIGIGISVIPGILALTGAEWIKSVSWSSQLSGTGFNITPVNMIWCILWLCLGLAGTIVSAKIWWRYRS